MNNYYEKWRKYIHKKEKKWWPRRDSNTQPSDLESDALPLRHEVLVQLIISTLKILLNIRREIRYIDYVREYVNAV